MGDSVRRPWQTASPFVQWRWTPLATRLARHEQHCSEGPLVVEVGGGCWVLGAGCWVVGGGWWVAGGE